LCERGLTCPSQPTRHAARRPPGGAPENRHPGSNIRSHADPHQHSCRPTSAPVRNRYILLSISFYSRFFYLWGTPRDPISKPDRSPPFVRDFGPLIPAHGNRRLHGRLNGQSPAVGLQNCHQPRTFRARAATGLSAVLAVGFGESCGSRGGIERHVLRATNDNGPGTHEMPSPVVNRQWRSLV
jgi:hypothetical protein